MLYSLLCHLAEVYKAAKPLHVLLAAHAMLSCMHFAVLHFEEFAILNPEPLHCWHGMLQDGTEDTTPSSATPLDDASDTTAVPAPTLPTPEDEEDGPSANGFHLPNGSTVTDSDGFRRQHERRPAASNTRPGPRRTEHQQSDDSFRCFASATVFANCSLCWGHRREGAKVQRQSLTVEWHVSDLCLHNVSVLCRLPHSVFPCIYLLHHLEYVCSLAVQPCMACMVGPFAWSSPGLAGNVHMTLSNRLPLQATLSRSKSAGRQPRPERRLHQPRLKR